MKRTAKELEKKSEPNKDGKSLGGNETRADRIAKIKAQLDAGTYSVDSLQLGKALVSKHVRQPARSKLPGRDLRDVK